ncbi:MAG: TonB-dependent receptor plug domain-containing protein [Fibrobacterota bacterium]
MPGALNAAGFFIFLFFLRGAVFPASVDILTEKTDSSAVPHASFFSRSGFSKEVIEIKKNAGNSVLVSAVLEEVPGVSVKRSGGIGSALNLSIRGVGGGRIRYYLNDIPLNSASGTEVNIDGISLTSIEKIEIYKGNVPLEYGGSGTGGVVRLVTSETSSGTEYMLSGGSGSYGYGEISAGFGKRAGRYSLRAGINYSEAENNFEFLNNNGTQYNLSDDFSDIRKNDYYRNFSITAGGKLKTGNTSMLRQSFSAGKEKKGLPGKPNYPVHTGRTSINTINSQTDYMFSPFLPLDIKMTAVVSAREYETLFLEDEYGYITGKKIHRIDTSISLNPKLDFRFYKGTGEFRIFGEYRTEEYMPGDRENPGDLEAYSNLRESGGIGAGLRISSFEFLKFNCQFRHDAVNSRFEGGVKKWSGDTLSGGTVSDKWNSFRFSIESSPHVSLSFFASLSRLYNYPSLFQLFGNRGFMEGNDELRPEKALNIEAGARHSRIIFNSVSLDGSFAFFRNRMEDNIVLARKVYTSRYINNESALIKGLEIEWNADIKGRLSYRQAWTLQEPLNTGEGIYNGKLLPLESRFSYEDELRLIAVREKKPLPGVSVFMKHANRSDYYTAPVNDVLHLVPASHIWDAGLSLNFREFEANAVFENFTDEKRFDTFGMPVPGRMFFVKAFYNFSRN